MPFSHSYVALFLFSLGLDAGAGAEGEEIEIHGDTLNRTGKCRKMQKELNLKFDIRKAKDVFETMSHLPIQTHLRGENGQTHLLSVASELCRQNQAN